MIRKTINDINSDFVERIAGSSKALALQIVPSGNVSCNIFVTIKSFATELGALGMFSLFGQEEPGTESAGGKFIAVARKRTGIEQGKGTDAFDTFELQSLARRTIRQRWVELANVGSGRTDILVKAMINIMLLNAIKERHRTSSTISSCTADGRDRKN